MGALRLAKRMYDTNAAVASDTPARVPCAYHLEGQGVWMMG
jgi:hypothetical protein